MSKVYDLDALAEEVEGKRIKLGGRTWDLPGELPLLALEYLLGGRIEDGASILVGEEDGPELAPLLSAQAVRHILGEVYGLAPEGGASDGSSRSTAKRSRPTSSRRTA